MKTLTKYAIMSLSCHALVINLQPTLTNMGSLFTHDIELHDQNIIRRRYAATPLYRPTITVVQMHKPC